MINNAELKTTILNKINNKTKPLGALGTLETLALQIALIQNTESPVITNPTVVVFAADHGIALNNEVNIYPQAVTAQMVLNFCSGGAAINVFCKQNNIALLIVDAGVNFNFDPTLPIVHAKVAPGTNNYCNGYAIDPLQIETILKKGGNIVETIVNKGCNTISFGEMGISNTSSAALIMHYYTGLPLAQCVGRGTGANDAQLQKKMETLQQAADYHLLSAKNITPTNLLACIGGYEIVMMVGAYLKAYQLGITILVDGFIATAALYSAIKILNSPAEAPGNITGDSNLLNHCIFCHASGEQGHLAMLNALKAEPLLNLNMRLGEGTGAAIAMPIIQSAVAFLNNMASFESAGVSTKEAE